MVVITAIYQPNDQTRQMVKSFERHGYEVAVLTDSFRGNGDAMKRLYACYKRAVSGHTHAIYSDGGDTFCQRTFDFPSILTWSAEKACYPHPEVAKRYKYGNAFKSPWRYLNNGGYGGPLDALIEFFDRYGLNRLPNEANGQAEAMEAYLKAKEDGLPIKLDTRCDLFQCIAHSEPTDFSFNGQILKNNVTKTTPAILHGNGRTDMNHIYEKWA
jgi:hypothetical protein